MLTISEIKDILRRERIFISKRRGQNFLVDGRIQKMIIQALAIKPDDQILEIGPGLGALTEDLVKGTNQVIAVEKDKGLVRVLQKKLSRYLNLKLICADILAVDLGKFAQKRLKVVGNLPYYITTPIIAYLLEKQRQNLEEIFITVQNEVGRRLAAQKGSKDYAAITILVQYFTQPRIIFTLPKKAFYPQPKVESAFVHLQMLSEPRVKVNNEKVFFKIVRTLFNQRRKTILSSLMHKLDKTEKGNISRALIEARVDIQARPEDLSIEEFAQIEEALFKRGHNLRNEVT